MSAVRQQIIHALSLEADTRWREPIRAASSLALFLDFDGTLAPIAPKPELAVIDPHIRSLLERLRRTQAIQIAIISGRDIQDVRARVDLDGIVYAGSHGLQIETETMCFREPGAEMLRLELKRIELRLKQLFSDASGVEVESKNLGVAVHYRLVHPSLHDWVRRSVITSVCRLPQFTCIPGKMVVDIRPAVDWNKGSAVEWLLEHCAPVGAFPVFIGDDTTDEDAFAALAKTDALTIRVGPLCPTTAKYWISDVCAVRTFLAAVLELRTAEKR